MKEQYFSAQSLLAKSHEICQSLDNPRRLRNLDRFDLQRSALLVLDMQEFFLHSDSHACIPSARAIIPGIQALIDVYKNNGLLVVFTRHLNTEQNARNMSTWWKEVITEANPLSRITPAFDTSGSMMLIKTQYDAFYDTSLQVRLNERQVKQIVICGVMTHLCCETTARSAFMHGFEVFFTVDGTATYTEAFHRATLLNIAHGFATPVLLGELQTGSQKIIHASI